MEGGKSGKDFDPRRHRDDYSGGGEVGPGVDIYPHGEYMVSPDDKPEEGNSPHGVDYAQGPEAVTLGGVVVDDLGYYPEAREDKNVHLGVTKKSEEVLI